MNFKSTALTNPLYIGLMSGTSVDGVNAVIVGFANKTKKIDIIASHLEEVPAALRQKALQISLAQVKGSLFNIAELDASFGQLFAQTVERLLHKAGLKNTQITAIGSHGQTLWHHPHPPIPFTVQIGDPNIIAKQTGIITVADFRRGDMALGGQGAPLLTPFHQWIFGETPKPRVIVNIGGIANVTILPQEGQPCLGFDTGPGNGLMDAWVSYHASQPYDKDGLWAQQGNCRPELLKELLSDPYFKQLPPKSTGKDHFNLHWLERYLVSFPLSPVDVQATLLELTAITIAQAIQAHRIEGEILVCGGGSHNPALLAALQKQLTTKFTITTTEQYGLDPDWVEATCFAWFAKQRLDHQAIDFTSITGASRPTILGGIYAP